MTENRQLAHQDVYDLSARASQWVGASPLQTAPTAQSIKEAEADGIRNVGLAMVPVYCALLNSGKVNGHGKNHEVF